MQRLISLYATPGFMGCKISALRPEFLRVCTSGSDSCISEVQI